MTTSYNGPVDRISGAVAELVHRKDMVPRPANHGDPILEVRLAIGIHRRRKASLMSKNVLAANHFTQIFHHWATCYLRSVKVKKCGTRCRLAFGVEVGVPTKHPTLFVQLDGGEVVQGKGRAQKYEKEVRSHRKGWSGFTQLEPRAANVNSFQVSQNIKQLACQRSHPMQHVLPPIAVQHRRVCISIEQLPVVSHLRSLLLESAEPVETISPQDSPSQTLLVEPKLKAYQMLQVACWASKNRLSNLPRAVSIGSTFRPACWAAGRALLKVSRLSTTTWRRCILQHSRLSILENSCQKKNISHVCVKSKLRSFQSMFVHICLSGTLRQAIQSRISNRALLPAAHAPNMAQRAVFRPRMGPYPRSTLLNVTLFFLKKHLDFYHRNVCTRLHHVTWTYLQQKLGYVYIIYI